MARAFIRLDVDERRRRLLDLGQTLFTSFPYDELSMAAIAKEAGISKALLYHYFPSKQAYFVATLQGAAQELAERITPDADHPPQEQLANAMGVWLEWVDGNRESYGKLLLAAGAVPEVRDLIDGVRATTVALILKRLLDGAPAPPELRTAVHGWLWFMDGACLEWVRTGALDRDQMHGLLTSVLPGAIRAAGHPEVAAKLS